MDTKNRSAYAQPHLGASAAVRGLPAPPFEATRPAEWTLALVLASPHSGRDYPPEFVKASRLDARALRKSEDAFVDMIFAPAAAQGAPLIQALFPRAYLDVNREPFELDPDMFEDTLPAYVNATSPRVAAGLGSVARVVASGQEIYRRKMRFSEALTRIDGLHRPYHAALGALIDETRERFGHCVLLDCHSMPSAGATADFVLGDRHGAACAEAVTAEAEKVLRRFGYVVHRNAPYAGGYTTRRYGQPASGVHALQIEINRALYMDESDMAPKPFLATLARQMAELADALGRLRPVPRS